MRAQLIEDGTYPNAAAVLAGTAGEATAPITPPPMRPNLAQPGITDYDPAQPRDPAGRWTAGGGGSPATALRAKASAPTTPTVNTVLQQLGHLVSPLNPIGTAAAQEIDPEEENRGLAEELVDPAAEARKTRYTEAMNTLRVIDPKNPELVTLTAPDYVPSEADILRVDAAAEAASIKRVCDYVRPDGRWIGQAGSRTSVRELPGGLPTAQRDFDHLSVGGRPVPFRNGMIARLPGNAGTITYRPVSSSPGSPAIDVNVKGLRPTRFHY